MSSWEAARSHPFTYPGTHPAGGFALIDDAVHDVIWHEPPHPESIGLGAAGAMLDDILSERRLPALQHRYPVLTYGGNRNPATLRLKLEHYGYTSPGDGTVLPVLPARIRGFDAVAGGLSSQGYLYADMYADDRTADTELFVHVLLLDADQLRVMHDSEGVRSDLYGVVALDGVEFVQDSQRFGFSAMAYLGVDAVVISKLLDSPIAFEAVMASGRGRRRAQGSGRGPEGPARGCLRTDAISQRAVVVSAAHRPTSCAGLRAAGNLAQGQAAKHIARIKYP
jgi:hypothetical protein